MEQPPLTAPSIPEDLFYSLYPHERPALGRADEEEPEQEGGGAAPAPLPAGTLSDDQPAGVAPPQLPAHAVVIGAAQEGASQGEPVIRLDENDFGRLLDEFEASHPTTTPQPPVAAAAMAIPREGEEPSESVEDPLAPQRQQQQRRQRIGAAGPRARRTNREGTIAQRFAESTAIVSSGYKPSSKGFEPNWVGRLVRKGSRFYGKSTTDRQISGIVYYPGLEQKLKEQVDKDQALEGARLWPSEPVLVYLQRMERELVLELRSLQSGLGRIENLGGPHEGRRGLASYIWKALLFHQEETARGPVKKVRVLLSGDIMASGQSLRNMQGADYDRAVEAFADVALDKICLSNRTAGRLCVVRMAHGHQPTDDMLTTVLERAGVRLGELTQEQQQRLNDIMQASERVMRAMVALTRFCLDAHVKEQRLPVFIAAFPLYFEEKATVERPDYAGHRDQGYGPQGSRVPWDPEWNMNRWQHVGLEKVKLVAVPGAAPALPAPLAVAPPAAPPGSVLANALQNALPGAVIPPAAELARLQRAESEHNEAAARMLREVPAPKRQAAMNAENAQSVAQLAKRKRPSPAEEVALNEEAARIRQQRQQDAQNLTSIIEGLQQVRAQAIQDFTDERLQEAIENLRITPTVRDPLGLGAVRVLEVLQHLRARQYGADMALTAFDELWRIGVSGLDQDLRQPGNEQVARVYAFWRRVLQVLLVPFMRAQAAPPALAPSAPPATTPVPASASPPTPPTLLQDERPEQQDILPLEDMPSLEAPAGPQPPGFMLTEPLVTLQDEDRLVNHTRQPISLELVQQIRQQRLLPLRQAHADGVFEQGMQRYMDAIMRALRHRTMLPVSAFCCAVPWRVLHDAVTDRNDVRKVLPETQYRFDVRPDRIGVKQLERLFRSANNYVAMNLERIYRYYYALHLLASRGADMRELEALQGLNVPLELVFPNWRAQFMHYVMSTTQTAQFDGDLFERLQPFRRQTSYPPVSVIQFHLVGLPSGQRSISGVLDRNAYEEIFGSDFGALAVVAVPTDTQPELFTKRYIFMPSSSVPARLLLIDSPAPARARAWLEIQYSLTQGVSRVHLRGSKMQLAGRLDLDVVVTISTTDDVGNLAQLRSSEMFSVRASSAGRPVHTLDETGVTFQPALHYSVPLYFRSLQEVPTGTIFLRHHDTPRLSGPNAHPFLREVRVQNGGEVPDQLLSNDNTPVTDDRRFTLLIQMDRNRMRAILHFYERRPDGSSTLIRGDLPIPGIALSLRSMLFYSQTGDFEQEMSIHVQPRGTTHFAVRAPCMRLPNSVLRDALVITDDRTDLTNFPLVLTSASQSLEAMRVDALISSKPQAATGDNFKCEVCGSTSLVQAHIFRVNRSIGRSARQSDLGMRGQKQHFACGGACVRRIVTMNSYGVI